ncbi:predicted protein [Botrytis cinerea T4]|uniref:Uncharacterized protein n=1 Tax=Botryotinia fuckeliana (strain T4) TaxID=999810 RepID=G2XPT8_BOTF4|nr:predicted protein [Botrytis cinerea T4]
MTSLRILALHISNSDHQGGRLPLSLYCKLPGGGLSFSSPTSIVTLATLSNELIIHYLR